MKSLRNHRLAKLYVSTQKCNLKCFIGHPVRNGAGAKLTFCRNKNPFPINCIRTPLTPRTIVLDGNLCKVLVRLGGGRLAA